jgi:hypothetical protein
MKKETKSIPFTQSQALELVFSKTNQEIQRNAKVDKYQTVASWRKRWKNGNLSAEKAAKILLALGFTQVEEFRWTIN